MQGRGIAAEAARKTKAKQEKLRGGQSRALGQRRIILVVEGAGDWVQEAYRTLFEKLVGRGYELAVFYADDTSWRPRPAWADPKVLKPWETYLDKVDPGDFQRYEKIAAITDVVFIVTPDFTHCATARWWLDRTGVVFIEKPFDSQLANVIPLLLDLGRDRPRTAVFGLDHYQFYALPLYELIAKVESHLGTLTNVDFYMAEKRPIELGRERTLQYGLTLDLLPHLLALLTYFGDLRTIDEIQVVAAGQYDPLQAFSRNGNEQKDLVGQFRNETYSIVKFSFRDNSVSVNRVPCTAIVGKGFSQDVKYFELTGTNNQRVRVDFNRRPNPDPAPNYPWDSLFFLHGGKTPLSKGVEIQTVTDPYDADRALHILHDPSDPQRFRRPLERGRYEKLLEDLRQGTSSAVAGTLLLPEAEAVVQSLDRIWWGIQTARPLWRNLKLDKSTPTQVVKENLK